MSIPQGDVEGLRVVVVGGGSGVLGGAIAIGLANLGAMVVTSSRSSKCQSELPNVVLDVTDPASIESGLSTARGDLGGIDGVINASGVTHRAPILETQVDDWRKTLDVNLTGAFLITQAAGRLMAAKPTVQESRGAVVHMTSLCATRGCEEAVGYSASKAGLLGLTRTAAVELAPLGIRVNCITPGVFLTPLNRDALQGTARGASALAATPMGHYGKPEDLVGAARLLIGRHGNFITGTQIVVDGGYLASGLGDRGTRAGTEGHA